LRAVTARPTPRTRVTASQLLAAVWIVAVLVVSWQATLRPSNNFAIFRSAWVDLAGGGNLYDVTERHADVFLYSPTFALLFAPFQAVPLWLGVLLWNGVNALALYWALGRTLTPVQARTARWIVLLDMIGALQSGQSNALVAGLMILTFAEAERRHEFRAAIAVALATAIKIFPIAAATVFVFRPERLGRALGNCLLIGAALIAAPLLVTSPAELTKHYQTWMIAQDAFARGAGVLQDWRSYSVMEHLRAWFGVALPNWVGQAAGVMILLAPLSRRRAWSDARFRQLYLASVLMFSVLFNHAAEPPTFVIAVAGVAIWFATSGRDRVAWTMLVVVFLGTVLVASDAMPHALQRNFLEPYRFKTLPILAAWFLVQIALWGRTSSAAHPAPESGPAAPAT
jgi:hypothetical protein